MSLHPVSRSLAGARRPLLAAGLCLLPLLLGAAPASREKSDGPRFGIIVQTDSQGQIRPCHCPGEPINGLGRRNGVFNMIRAFRYPVTVLDGGDCVPDPADPLAGPLRDLMIQAMTAMRYDAVAVGELDLLSGPEHFRRAAAALPLVCANLQTGPGLDVDVPAVRWIDAGEQRVAVTSVLDPLLFYTAPGAFDLYGEDLVLTDAVESLKETVAEVRPKADLVVLLAHASLEGIDGFLDAVPGIDVVVQGHAPERAVNGVPRKGAIFVVPEPRSRQVTQITLTLDPPRPVAVQAARLWDLRRTTREDGRLDDMVEAFEKRHGSQ
jgi:2',3'-cyclic-nucleotide 2'-phosphodiesterase (5'-nucleotidase family)